MADEREIRDLIKEAHQRGAIIRVWYAASGRIMYVSVGKTPGGPYRKIGEPGTHWMTPLSAAERIREMLASVEEAP